MPGLLGNALNAGKAAGQKAKIKAEIVMLDRQIVARKKALGKEMYDELGYITCSQDFYSTNDRTISAIRPLILACDREIRALSNKNLQAKGNLDIAKARRAEAFPTRANSLKERAQNAATATGMLSNETKIKTEMAVVNSKMNHIKEKFGMDLYPVLDEISLQIGMGQVPVHCSTDKDINAIRAIFQKCNTDVQDIQRSKANKKQQIDALDVDVSLRRL